MSRTSYGADRNTFLLLYLSMIRSKLDYASFVYECASESSKRRLDSVHHASLRVVTGAFHTSPVVGDVKSLRSALGDAYYIQF